MSKVWLITGGSRGLGLEIARTALEAGEYVVATARDAVTVRAALPKTDHLLALSLDVTDPSAASAVVDQVVKRFGSVDVLVNCAGFGQFGPFEEFSEQEIYQLFEVNLFGSMRVTRAVLPIMRKQHAGRIFNISSAAGLTGNAMSSLYCSSKFAVEGWSESLSMELDPLGIKVTVVTPGMFRTNFLSKESARYVDVKHEEYKQAAEGLRSFLESSDGKQPGDPKRLATVLLQLADADRQPLRLLMGSDAVSWMEGRSKRDLEGATEWESLSRSTDF
jgi:NAD(P)-dependent dehydrogenase (short-subunit alcohol dehydrogenase family)